MSDREGSAMPMRLGLAGLALGLFTAPWLDSPAVYLPLMVSGGGLGLFSSGSLAYLSGRAGEGQRGAAGGTYYLVWGVGYFGGPLLLDWFFASSGQMGQGIRLLGLGMALCLAWLVLHERRFKP